MTEAALNVLQVLQQNINCTSRGKVNHLNYLYTVCRRLANGLTDKGVKCFYVEHAVNMTRFLYVSYSNCFKKVSH